MESTSSSSRRLFLCFSLPPEAQAALDAWQAGLPDAGEAAWATPEKRHLTLCFIGAVPELMLPNLVSLIRVGFRHEEAFPLQFRDYCWAPPGQEPRMIWARWHKHPAFVQMARRAEWLLTPLFERQAERRSPIPHITLARLRPRGEPLPLPQAPAPPPLPLRELLLWESHKQPGGTTYERLESFRLR
jgi:2'-5' RNA ligase